MIALYCIWQDRIELFLELFQKNGFRLSLCGLMAVTGLLFVLPFRLRKPQSKELYWFLALGVLMALVLLFVYFRIV